MNTSDQTVQQKPAPSGEPATGPIFVRGRADVPRDAPAHRAYRVEVLVVSVTERATIDGKPCFFLKVRDADGRLFFVVVWDRQWEVLRQRVSVDRPAVLDVRPPAPGRSAFTLA